MDGPRTDPALFGALENVVEAVSDPTLNMPSVTWVHGSTWHAAPQIHLMALVSLAVSAVKRVNGTSHVCILGRYGLWGGSLLGYAV